MDQLGVFILITPPHLILQLVVIPIENPLLAIELGKSNIYTHHRFIQYFKLNNIHQLDYINSTLIILKDNIRIINNHTHINSQLIHLIIKVEPIYNLLLQKFVTDKKETSIKRMDQFHRNRTKIAFWLWFTMIRQ